jgi:hypothetical protein
MKRLYRLYSLHIGDKGSRSVESSKIDNGSNFEIGVGDGVGQGVGSGDEVGVGIGVAVALDLV